MNNKTLGNTFERELAEYLAAHGFWAHVMASKASGQPADVIAARHGRAHLIDAKECTNNTFPLSRVEANQHTAMTLWEECENGTPWFAMRLSDGDVFVLPFCTVQSYAFLHDKKHLSEADIRREGVPLITWMEVFA